MTIQSVKFSEANASKAYPDLENYTVGDNGGVRFVCLLDNPACRADIEADPTDGETITNLQRQGEGDGNGTAEINTLAGATMPMGGGGFDLSGSRSGTTGGPTGISAPAAAIADIWGAAPAGSAHPGTSQRFLVWEVVKLPLTSDWKSSGAVCALMAAADQPSYIAGPELVQADMRVGAPYALTFRRQVAVNTLEQSGGIILQPADDCYGNVVLLAYSHDGATSKGMLLYRDGDGDDQEIIASVANSTANTQDFSARNMVFGHPLPFFASETGYNGARLYGCGIENLARSGRDPLAVMRALWADLMRYGNFS